MKKILFTLVILLLPGCGSDVMNIENKNIVFERSTFDNPGEKELKFILKNDDGSYIFDDDLEVTNAEKIHFVITRDNLKYFQHLYPEPDDQFWKVKANFPETGLYNVYTDFKVKDQPVRTIFNTITIGDAKADKNYPSLNTNNVSTQAGITASIEIDPGESNRNNTLQFFLQKDGKTVSTLKPILGAGGYVIVFKQNEPELYLHTYPIGNSKNDGKLKYMTKFSTPGTYTAFLQVNDNETTRIFPFTFKIL